jgi:hypothetical protein
LVCDILDLDSCRKSLEIRCVRISNVMFEENGSVRNFVADSSDGSWLQRATLHPAVENIREIWLCSTDALLGQRIY